MKISITMLLEVNEKDWLEPAIPELDIVNEVTTYIVDQLQAEGIVADSRGIKIISYESRDVTQQDADELTACPRCGSEIYWDKLFDDRDELFAMCTTCTWGED